MMIRNVIYPHKVNGKLFMMKGSTIRAFHLDSGDGDDRKTCFLHRIRFKFSFHRGNITRMQFKVIIAFTVSLHKAEVQTLAKVVV